MMQKSMRLVAQLMVLAMLISACGGEADIQPTATLTPAPDTDGATDGAILDGMAVVESIEIEMLESFPVQVNVIASGYLPDGCTSLIDAVVLPIEGGFDVRLPTSRPADAICTQQIVEFERTISLPVQGYEAGTYTVTVNGQSATFDLEVDNGME